MSEDGVKPSIYLESSRRTNGRRFSPATTEGCVPWLVLIGEKAEACDVQYSACIGVEAVLVSDVYSILYVHGHVLLLAWTLYFQ